MWPLSTASLRELGLSRRLALLLPPVIAVAWTGLFFVGTWHGFARDRAAAAHKHRIVLRAVPVYPGARFTDERTWGRGAGDVGDEGFVNPPAELLTTWTWRLPPHAGTRAVADWYERRLRQAGWHVNRDDLDPRTVLLVAARTGPALADPRDVPLEVDVYASRSAQAGSNPSHALPAEVMATAGP